MSELKQTMQRAREFIAANLAECCRDELDWQKSSILRDGKLREAAAIFGEVDKTHAIPMAQSETARQAMQLACRTQPEATKPAQDLGAAILEQAAQACDQQADGTNGAYRTACLQCANAVRELRDAALASPADALVEGDRVDLENWNTQMAGVKALLECTEGELECIDGKLLKDYVEHVKRIYAAIQAQKDGHAE